MKILYVNKFYYPRGGDCIYTIELEKLLNSRGHQTAVFSMHHEQNLPNQYSRFWASALEYSGKNPANLKETLLRPIYSSEVRRKFISLLDFFKPDVVHLNNIHTQISPIVAEISHKLGIKVVWTLHDYKVICPSYLCLRDNMPCELCIKNKRNVIKYKCIKASTIGSIVGYAEAIKWNLEKLQTYTDRFVCPSNFMKNLMLKAGGVENKYSVIHNFIQDEKILTEPVQKDNYFCYVGRLSNEKGIATLLEAMKVLPEYNLKVIGGGPLEGELVKKYSEISNVEFLGFIKWEEIQQIVKKANFSVIPSKCYENNPLSVIESFALGTPVIGSRIGGIPELIIEGYNGLLFETGNCMDLAKKIRYFYAELADKNLGKNTIEFSQQKFSSNVYYDKINKVYSEVLSN